MKTFLGIDFGTTQTVVTMIREGSNYEPEIVEIDGKKTVDTALRLDAEDNVLFFGADALDRIYEAPDDTFYNFKVDIRSGKAFRSSNKDYKPETLALLFLKHLRQKIETKYFNVDSLEQLEDLYCTIGCPAAWNEVQRRTIIDIAKRAGFPNVSCCDEPFGVIYYYHFRGDLSLATHQNVLVYDFGGGTTDVAIEKILPNADGSPCKTPRVLAAGGMSNLGGKHFDEKLKEYFIQEMNADAATLGDKDLKTLERYSKLIKETLSVAVDNGTDSVEKTIPMLSSKRSSHKLALSKQKFEQVCGFLIEQLEEPVYDALNITALNANEINNVIVAGGSSRLYYVKSRIKTLFPKSNIIVSANPVEVIAKGLALYARAFASEAKTEPVQQENSRQEKVESDDKKTAPQKEAVKPKQEKPSPSRKWSTLIAVAAVIVIAVLGGGYWHIRETNLALEAKTQAEAKAKAEADALAKALAQAQAEAKAKEEEAIAKAEIEAKAQAKAEAISQYELGQKYARGNGVAQDFRKAREFYLKAADYGYAPAQYELGEIYRFGLGVGYDYKQSLEWYRKAADRGLDQAQYSVGYAYNTGRGVAQDFREAYFYFYWAMLNGNSNAMAQLVALDKICSREAIEQAKQRANQAYEQQILYMETS
ncbi:hypothetical protein FACS1894187_14720 [Synergistales bacterium]|nr:hypothetical protein FACS1894187_14720 [Synergistales bacterium]